MIKTTFILRLAFCIAAVPMGLLAQLPPERAMASVARVESFHWYSSRDIPDPVHPGGYRPGETVQAQVDRSVPKPPPANETFFYEVKIKNLTREPIVSVRWTFESLDPISLGVVGRVAFVSRTSIRPGKSRTIAEGSPHPPARVVAMDTLRLGKGDNERVIIRGVEFKSPGTRAARTATKF